MSARSTTLAQKQPSKQHSLMNRAGHPRHFSKSTMSSEMSFSSFQTALKNETTWTPRDAREIVKQWKEAATFRTYGDAHGSADNKYFAPEQIKCIHRHYVDWFISNEANAIQQKETYSRKKNKSRAEARLRRLCGHMHMVHAIWAVGLPNTHEPSSTDDAIEHIQSITEEIFDWLTYIEKSHPCT